MSDIRLDPATLREVRRMLTLPGGKGGKWRASLLVWLDQLADRAESSRERAQSPREGEAGPNASETGRENRQPEGDDPAGAAVMSGLHEVTLMLCDLCLDGAGGECHTPGCSLWLNRAPDRPFRDHPCVTTIDGKPAPAYAAGGAATVARNCWRVRRHDHRPWPIIRRVPKGA